ncbi:hypothetical protein PORY_001518 [Pneumocystis oryctolagi]|uniref:Uncharacterized protein n=1 Tax=Pneumocystis oryctolagi TaxID=42067 RepID=A0ACB7CEH9_9ASCO|nr:hypothetical protein PORY_001518 [Pneumocystis oryctolagi]
MLSNLNRARETNVLLRTVMPVIFIIIFPISIAIIVLIFIHQKHRRRILKEDHESSCEHIKSGFRQRSKVLLFLSSFFCLKKQKLQTNIRKHHSQESSFNDTIPDNYLPPVLFPSQKDLNFFERTFHKNLNDTRYHTGIST